MGVKSVESKIKKTAIVLKAGRSKAGMKAASSHTGALGSKDKVVDAVLKQAGIIRAETIGEMFDTAKAFNNFPLPKGKRIAVVTNAGGPAILAVDALEKEGLQLAELSERTKKKLEKIVPREGSKNNPVDLLPGATAEIYKATNEIVLSDKNVDAVISIFVEPVMVSPLPVVEAVNSIKSKKPIYQVVMPLPEFWRNYRENSSFGTSLFRTPEAPASIISNLIFSMDRKKVLKSNRAVLKEQMEKSGSKKIKFHGLLSPKETDKIARKYKIPVVKNIYVKTLELKNIKDLNFPLVLKGINSRLSHKSDTGAVEINIKTKAELMRSAKKIKDRMNASGFEVEKFLIQPFVSAKHELLIGGFRDESFGPVIMFGSGGKYVEQIDDTEIRSAFLTENDAVEMTLSTKIGKILQGVRGEKPADLKRLTSIILRAAKMLRENENLIEFDINPLILTDYGRFLAVDFRIKTEQ